MRQQQYYAPWGYVRQSQLGVDEVPVDAVALLQAQRTDLDALRSIMEKDLFWRRVSTIATIAGVVIGAAKLTDILISIRRRRSEGTTP